MHTLKAGDQGRDPFNQNFRKFRSKTQFFRFGPTWKVLKNGPLRKQRVMVWDLWQVDFYPFSVFQGLLLLNFRVRSRVFESAVSFTLAQFCYLFYTETWQVYIPKVKLFLKSFQIQKKQRMEGWKRIGTFPPTFTLAWFSYTAEVPAT